MSVIPYSLPAAAIDSLTILLKSLLNVLAKSLTSFCACGGNFVARVPRVPMYLSISSDRFAPGARSLSF